MDFQKINENKIKVILNISDLTKQNVDFHSFMSNPLSSQEFFTAILDTAEKKVGFTTKNYNVKIEILSLSNIDFIITLTKIPINIAPTPPKVLVTSQNAKISSTSSEILMTSKEIPKPAIFIYQFERFTDFYDFSLLFSKLKYKKQIAKKIVLYKYNQKYYLLINTFKINNAQELKFNNIITDFATYVHNSEIFDKKLSEYGKIILNHNVLTKI